MDQRQTQQACKNAMEHYRVIWFNDNDPTHFWQKANQLISIFQFAKTCTKAFGTSYDYYQLANDPTSRFLNDFWNSFQAATANEYLWTDDYGWGGIACLEVARWLKINRPNASPSWKDYRSGAIMCYNRMKDVTLLVSVQNTTPIPGGCSNQPLKADSASGEYWKNTVTNALYFNLSMQLYEFLTEFPDSTAGLSPGSCLYSAYNQYIYFASWFGITPHPPDVPDPYLHRLATSADIAMIEERPVALAPDWRGYDPNNTEITWIPSSMWSGDQGLFVNACAILFNNQEALDAILPPEAVEKIVSDLRKWLVYIPTAVYQALTFPSALNEERGDDVLREAPFANNFDSSANYMCGRGVLARFFTHDATLTAFKKVFDGPVPLFAKCFEQTALAVSKTAAGEGGEGQLSVCWNPENDTNANENFIRLWGTGETFHEWSSDRTDPIWHNYSMMLGFDLYQAWIKMNPAWGAGSESGEPNGC